VRIEVSEPAQLHSLIRFLEFDQNVLVTRLSETEIEVGFIGSLNIDAQRTETQLRLRSWSASHPHTITTLRE